MYDVVAHQRDGGIIVELEHITAGEAELIDAYSPIEEFLASRTEDGGLLGLAISAARVIRRVTNFDRVLVYRFNENWNGKVIAEDRNETLPSYLGLSFPASDIPKQARELYRTNRIRLIADADYLPVSIVPELNPLTNCPLDLSFSTLRSVSPIHLEYMRNMGTMASMSFSLLRDGELWGMISCHNKLPRHASFQRRAACDILCQILSLQLGSQERNEEGQRLNFLQRVQAQLLRQMTESPRFIDGLLENARRLARPDRFTRRSYSFRTGLPSDWQYADGRSGARNRSVVTPEKHRGVLYGLPLRSMAASGGHAEVASGLLSVSISKLTGSRLAVRLAMQPLAKRRRALAMSTRPVRTGTPTASIDSTSASTNDNTTSRS